VPDIDDPFLDELEPTAAQTGLDVPGARGSFSDWINHGVFNGNFRVGPQNAAAGVDYVGAAGSNFLPGWRFVRQTGTINLTWYAADIDDFPPYIEFSGGAVNDIAYIEQIVDIGGSSVGDVGAFLRVNATSSILSGATENLIVARQYLTITGATIGSELSTTVSVAPTGYIYSFDDGTEMTPPPIEAKYLRLRVGWKRVGAVDATLVIYDIRRDRMVANLRLSDRDSTGYRRAQPGLYDVYQSSSNLFWQPSSTTGGVTTGKRLLNYQLVGIPFSLVNIPTNATTELQMWGDTALALGTPRIGLPWAAAIVGMSYRLSAIPTAGGANALRIQATVAGSSVWTAFTIPGSGGALSDENSQSTTADEIAKGAQVGIQVFTSNTYAPTTADIAAVLWLAVKYDGA
jgi:hypothetical protein